jgi:hypothetical protein
MLAVLVLAGLALAAMPASRAEATACTDLGGVEVPGVSCTVGAGVHAVVLTGLSPLPGLTLNIPESVIVSPGAIIKVTCVPASCAGVGPLIVSIDGDFSMAPGSTVDGTTTVNPGKGADLTFKATGNITLSGGSPGAIVQSNHVPASSCTNISAGVSSRGGNIALHADSDNDFDGAFDQGAGSLIATIAACGKGEITITGKDINVDGEVRSEGTRTVAVSGPITVNAKCKLNVSSTGEIISLGHDLGSDLVHLQGGCDVKILGLVASTAPGHTRNPRNRCDSSTPPGVIRPGKPNNSTACVEIWSGGPLLIDSATANGEVNADVGQSGGSEGLGWVEILALEDITIKGNISGGCTPIQFTGGAVLPTYTPCFSVHANQGAPGIGGISNGFGGLIRVISAKGSVIADNLAIQASDTANGGKGGRPALTVFCTAGAPCGGITIQGDVDVNLTGAKLEAKGAANGAGGQMDVQAFNGAIMASAATLLTVTGGTPSNGVVNLTACTTIAFPPGVVNPAAAATLNPLTGCGTHPALPAYVDLTFFTFLGPFPQLAFPPVPGGEKGCPRKCEGDCQCVGTFKLLTSPANTVELKGFNLNTTTKVRVSTASCDTTTGTDITPFTKVGAPPGTTLRFSVVGIPTGNYHIITESGFNVCCTVDTLNIP